MRPILLFRSTGLRGLAFLLAAAPLLMAPSCGPPFQGIAIQEPAANELETDGLVRVEVRVGLPIDETSVALLLDGVDLIGHFGLTPPFAGVGGMVAVGPDLVVVSDFSFDPAAPTPQLSLEATGLSAGPHDVQVTGFRPSDGLSLMPSRTFHLVGPLDEKARAVTAAGSRSPSVVAGSRLGHASLGDVSAAPPVAYPDGSELRAGIVETVEARLSGGTP